MTFIFPFTVKLVNYFIYKGRLDKKERFRHYPSATVLFKHGTRLNIQQLRNYLFFEFILYLIDTIFRNKRNQTSKPLYFLLKVSIIPFCFILYIFCIPSST